MMNKAIHRGQTTTKIFDNRSLEADYSTLLPILKEGMKVLDVGCGTGAISAGIAGRVGKTGYVIGIDNTEHFILSGKESYKDVSNLTLYHADLFKYEHEEKFDLIVAARVLQWLINPKEAIKKLTSLLRPGGQLSVLDYNHSALEWTPQPPESMQIFYKAFLKWRADAGMNNQIADDLEGYFSELDFQSVQKFPSNEVYTKGDDNFLQRVGIWSKVAELKQIVDEGYILEAERVRAISDYDHWVANQAERMVMKLNEIRGTLKE